MSMHSCKEPAPVRHPVYGAWTAKPHPDPESFKDECEEVLAHNRARPGGVMPIEAGGCAPPVYEVKEERATVLPTDSAERKNYPLCSGVLDYFPAALSEVARVSFIGNEKHNPGEPLHHARGKSMDHADCILRHQAERGTFDRVELKDGRVFLVLHEAYVAWRALAQLQEALEARGAPRARAAW